MPTETKKPPQKPKSETYTATREPIKNDIYRITINPNRSVNLINKQDGRTLTIQAFAMNDALIASRTELLVCEDEQPVVLRATSTRGDSITFEITAERVLGIIESIYQPGAAEKFKQDRADARKQLAELDPDAITEYQRKLEELKNASLSFLDVLARFFLDPKNGRTTSYVLQTSLGFLGIPGLWSVGDLLGILRGYLNLRQGNTMRGVAQMITAAIPGIPTPAAHLLIDNYVPAAQKLPTTTRTSPADLARAALAAAKQVRGALAPKPTSAPQLQHAT